MAARVILTKISPFASSKTSSLGFIEGAQRIRRFNGELDKMIDLDINEDTPFEEAQAKLKAMSLEDIRKVNWDKYSLKKPTFEETRTEGTKEIERVIKEMMEKEYEMRNRYECVTDMNDAQRIRRFNGDLESFMGRLDKLIDNEYKENIPLEEAKLKAVSLDLEDTKYSLKKPTFEETRTEGTKETERVIEEMMQKEYEMRNRYE